MSRLTLTVVTVCVAAAGISGAPRAPRPGVDWPQFRGIAASGIAEGFSLPTTWNAADGDERACGRRRSPASACRARSSGATTSSSRRRSAARPTRA